MSKRSREWKAWRAAARGELPNLPDENYRAFRQRAEEDRKTGYGWFADGFDDLPTDAVFAELQRIGLEVDEEGFRKAAYGRPGPTEISDAWEDRVRVTDERDELLPWLAARTLWARLLPDDISVETEADAIEAGIREVRRAGKDANPLPVILRIADACEGDPEIFDAIDDELHHNLGQWILMQVKSQRGLEAVEPWTEAVKALSPAMESGGLIELASAALLAKHDKAEEARSVVGQVLAEHGDLPLVLARASEVYLLAEDAGTAERVARRGIVLSEEDDEALECRGALSDALEAQGRAAQLPRIWQEATAERRARALERRAERRRREKRGKKGKRR